MTEKHISLDSVRTILKPIMHLLGMKADKSEVPDISVYAKKSDIPDVSGFARKDDIPDVSDRLQYADVYTVNDGAVEITWDGDTTGKDKIRYNSEDYWKVSDFALPSTYIAKAEAEYSDGRISETVIVGQNVFKVGGVHVVKNAGYCEITQITDMGIEITQSFTAPSKGTYFYGNESTAGFKYYVSAKFEIEAEKSAIHINSSTGRPFLITVDDSGTLTATEVTE